MFFAIGLGLVCMILSIIFDESGIPIQNKVDAKVVVGISDLPYIGFQRTYIDEFFAAEHNGKSYYIRGRKVVDAWYGHCMDYPEGFCVVFEK